jgi:PKD repeat protein
LRRAVLLLIAVMFLCATVSADQLIINFAADAKPSRIPTVAEGFATILHGPGTGFSSTGTTSETALYSNTTGLNVYMTSYRTFFTANLSDIPSGSTVTSVTTSFRYSVKNNNLGSLAFGLTNATPTNPEVMAKDDYNKTVNVRMATDKSYASLGAGWINYTFNSDGISYVQKRIGSNVTFVMRSAPDIDNNEAGITFVNGSGKWSGLSVVTIDNATYKPFITIDYTPPSSGVPVATFSTDRTSVGFEGSIQFTDLTTNSPTGWYWVFGDGNTSSLQNPAHVFSSPGTYNVNLTASNGYGSNQSAYTVITVNNFPTVYINKYSPMIPHLDQGSMPYCSGYSIANALMLMRYDKLAVAPSSTEETVTRNITYDWPGYSIISDVLPYYSPNMYGLYRTTYLQPKNVGYPSADGTDNLTAYGETAKLGYNFQSDRITSKYNNTLFYYPQTEAYLASHMVNKISDYNIYWGNDSGSWELLKQNISASGYVIIIHSNYLSKSNRST